MTSEMFKLCFWAWGRFCKYKASIDQKFIIEKVIIDGSGYSSRCPVNSFKKRLLYNGKIIVIM